MSMIYANLERQREAAGFVNDSPARRSVRQFHAQEIARMFRVPYRILVGTPWKANARRYGR